MAKKTIEQEVFDFISSGRTVLLKDIYKEFSFLKRVKLNSILLKFCDDNRVVKNASSDGVFYTTDRKSGQGQVALNEILRMAMKDGEFKTANELSIFCGVPRVAVRNALNGMIADNLVETMPRGGRNGILYKMVYISCESVKYKGADGIVRLTDRKTTSSGLNPYSDYRSFRPGGSPC